MNANVCVYVYACVCMPDQRDAENATSESGRVLLRLSIMEGLSRSDFTLAVS